MAKVETAPKKRAARKRAAKPENPAAEPEFDLDNLFAALDETEDFVNAVFYGKEGSGKTTCGARMVNIRKTGKLLVINAEGGLKKVPLTKRGVDVSRIEVWPRRGERITHKGLDLVHRKIKADLEADPNSWIGVVFDSATEIHQAILDFVQKRRVHLIKESGKDVDEDFVDIADYGTMSKMFRDILRKFRDLPCHFVVTALERRDVDKDTGKPQYGPAVTPGLQADLLGYVDWVLMFKAEDEDGPFRALTRANSRYRAKDRFDVLPRIVADPMFDRLLDYLNGDLTEEADPLQAQVTKRTKKAQDAAEPSEAEDEDLDDEDDEEDDEDAA